MKTLAKYNKALLLLGVIILAALAQVAGVDLGLEVEHYIGLLLVDLGVYAVPNREEKS